MPVKKAASARALPGPSLLDEVRRGADEVRAVRAQRGQEALLERDLLLEPIALALPAGNLLAQRRKGLVRCYRNLRP